MSAQNKLQRISLEKVPKLISTFFAFVHLDSKSPKVPFLIGLLCVGSTIWTFRHDISLFRVMGKIAIYRFHYVVEAPSQEAVEDYFKDIGFAFWNRIEIRQVKPAEEIIKAVIEKS